MTTARISFCTILIILGISAAWGTQQPPAQERSVEAKPVYGCFNWPIWYGKADYDGDVSFELTEEGVDYFNRGEKPHKLETCKVDFEPDSDGAKDFLDVFSMQACFCNFTSPDVGGGWGGGAFPIGRFRVNMAEGPLIISITRVGFCIGTKPSTKNVFYSPAGAEFVNLVYFANTGSQLPGVLVHTLSGENHLRSSLTYRPFAKRAAEAYKK